nr:MAG TPA: hypothetical protein [Caudoviricetes sp.]
MCGFFKHEPNAFYICYAMSIKIINDISHRGGDSL